MPSLNDKKLPTIKRKRSPSPTISVNLPNSLHKQAIENLPHSYNLRIKPWPKLIKNDSPKKKAPLPKTFQGKKELQRPNPKTKKSHDRCSFCSHFIPVDSASCVCFTCQSKYSEPKTYKSSRRSLSLGSASPDNELIGEKQKAIDNVLVIKPKEIVSVIGRQKQRYLARSRKLPISAWYKNLGLKKKSIPKLNSIENDLLEIKRMSEASNIELQKSLARSRSKKNTKCDEVNGIDDSRLTVSSGSKASWAIGSSKSIVRTPSRAAKRLKYDENEAIEIANEDLSNANEASTSGRLAKSTKKASKQCKKKTSYKHDVTENKSATLINKDSSPMSTTFLTARSSKYTENIPKRSTKKTDYFVDIRTNGTDIVPDETAFTKEEAHFSMRSSKFVEPASKRSKRIKYKDEIKNNKIGGKAFLTLSEAFLIAGSSKDKEETPKRSKKKTLYVEAVIANGTNLDPDETASTEKEALSKVRSSKSTEQTSKRSKKRSKSKDEMKNMTAESVSLCINEAFLTAGSSKIAEETPKRSTKKTEYEEKITTNGIDLVIKEISSTEEKTLSKMRSTKSIEQASKRSKRQVYKTETSNNETSSSAVSKVFPTVGSSKDTEETPKRSTKNTKYVEEITTNETDQIPGETVLTEEEAVPTVRTLQSTAEQASKRSKRSKYKGEIKNNKLASSAISEAVPIAGPSEQILKSSTRKTAYDDKIRRNRTASITKDINPAERNVRSSKSSDHNLIQSKKVTKCDEQNESSKTPNNADDAINSVNVLSPTEASSEFSEFTLMQLTRETECADKSHNTRILNGTEHEAVPVVKSSKTLKCTSLEPTRKSKTDDKIQENEFAEIAIGTISTVSEASSSMRLSQSSELSLVCLKEKVKNDETRKEESVEMANNTISTANEASSLMTASKSSEYASMQSKEVNKFDEKNGNEYPDIANDGIDTASKVLPTVRLSNSFEHASMESTSECADQNNDILIETTREASPEVRSSNTIEITSVESVKDARSGDMIQGNGYSESANRIISTSNVTSASMVSSQPSELIPVQSKKRAISDQEVQEEETARVTKNTTSTANDASSSMESLQFSEHSSTQSKKTIKCNDEIQETKTAEFINKASSTASPAARSSKRAKCGNNFQRKETDEITKEACSSISEASPVVPSSKSTEQQSTKRVECDSNIQISGTDEVVESGANVNDAVCPTFKPTKSAVVTRSKRLKSLKEKVFSLNSATRTSREADIDIMTSCNCTVEVNSSAQKQEINSPDLNKKTYECNMCHGLFSYRQRFRFHHNKCNLKSKIQNTVAAENDSLLSLPNSSEARSPEIIDKFSKMDVLFEDSNKISSNSASSQILLPDLNEDNTLQKIAEENLMCSCSPNVDSLQPSVEEKSISNETTSNLGTVLPCLKSNELFFNSTDSSLEIQNWENTEPRNESSFNITDLALSTADSSLGIQNWGNSQHSTESFFNTTEISVDAIASCFNSSELSLACTEPCFNTAELYLGTSDCLGIQNLRNDDSREESYLNTTDCPESSLEIQNLEETESKTESCLNTTEPSLNTEESCLNASEPTLSDAVFSSGIQNWEHTKHSSESTLNPTELSLGTKESSLGNQNWGNTKGRTGLPLQGTPHSAQEEPQVNLEDLESLLQDQEPSLEDLEISSESPKHSSEVIESRLKVSDCRLQCPESFFNETESCLKERESSIEECNSTLPATEFEIGGLNANLNETSLIGKETCLEGTVASLDGSESPLVEDSPHLVRSESSLPESNSVLEVTDGNLGEKSHLEVVESPVIESIVFNPLATDSNAVEFEILNSDSTLTGQESYINSQGETQYYLQKFEYGSHFVGFNSGKTEGFDNGKTNTCSERPANSVVQRALDKNPPFPFCPRIVDIFSLRKASDNPKSKNASPPESSPAVSKSLDKETAVRRIESKVKKSICRKKTSSSNDEAKTSEGSSKMKQQVCNALGSSKPNRKSDSENAKQPLVSKGSLDPKKKCSSKEVFKACCSCGKSLPVPSPSNSMATVDDHRVSISSNIACEACSNRQNVNIDVPTKFIQDTFKYFLSKFMSRNERMTRKNMVEAGVFQKTALNYVKSKKASSNQIELCVSGDSTIQVGAASNFANPRAEETLDCANTFAGSPLTAVDDSFGYSIENLPDTPSSSLSNPMSPSSCISSSDPIPHIALAASEVEDSVGYSAGSEVEDSASYSTGNLPDTPPSSLSNPMSPSSCTSLCDPIPRVTLVESEVEESLVANSDEVIFTEDFQKPYDVSSRDRALNSYLCHYCFENLKKNEISRHFYIKHNRTCKENCFNLLTDN